ncbi:MAG: Hpt domain-containing protein, partial [Rhodospirillales bacterium]|nr:Hpt domain-containing protein [Rhodospirillales bacterium]
MDDLLNEFLTEASENISVVDAELVKFEQHPTDAEILKNIFRLVHTIKGTSGFLGLPRLESLAHASEDVLGKFRDGDLKVTPNAVTLILKAIDAIKGLLAGLEDGGSEPAGDDTALIAELQALAAGDDGRAAETAPEVPEAKPAPVRAAVPAPAVGKGEGGAAKSEARRPRGSSPAARSIRVNVDHLETLMTLVSELVPTRNRLLKMAQGDRDGRFDAPLGHLSRITTDLQEGVMKTRMQPIGNAWAKLPRIIRDLSLKQGKKIAFTMQGADTELDRRILESIKDPMIHMVRNSVDHGVETPDERRRAGKPETGVVTVNAYHEGGHIMIEIVDDGRGLDMDRIRTKIVENGLATDDGLAGMSDGQIQQYIFKAGFSTAATVTGISGRGVGMDV